VEGSGEVERRRAPCGSAPGKHSGQPLGPDGGRDRRRGLVNPCGTVTLRGMIHPTRSPRRRQRQTGRSRNESVQRSIRSRPRTSTTVDQNIVRQLDGIEVERTFTDKASGKDTTRPKLDELIAFVRDGDTVIVHSMDRLARNVDDLRRLVRTLTGIGVRVEFAKENRSTNPCSPPSPPASPLHCPPPHRFQVSNATFRFRHTHDPCRTRRRPRARNPGPP
jgi:hypothetical protein